MTAAANIFGEMLFRVAVRATVALAFPVVGPLASDLIDKVFPKVDVDLAKELIDEVRGLFADKAWEWLLGRSVADQDAALNGISQIPHDRARKIVESEMESEAERLHQAADAKKALILRSTLSAVPMTARHALVSMQVVDSNVSPIDGFTRMPDPKQGLAKLVPFPPLFDPGHRLEHTDYTLVALLGQGGMGEVWQARNEHLPSKPPVAIKFCRDTKLLDLLRREIEVLNWLGNHYQDHGIIEVKETSLSAQRPYLVYEYVHGGTLWDWIGLYPEHVPVDRMLSMLRKLGRALAFAHDKRIVHRDLKPANVLVGTDGSVKLTDWGIAMTAGDKEDGVWIRHGHTIAMNSATDMYRDPELKRGAPVTPAQDVFSFGVIAYQMLVGNVTKPLTHAWKERVAERNGQVPPALLQLVERCVALEPARIASGTALLAALKALGDSSPPPRSRVPILIQGTVRCKSSGTALVGAEVTLTVGDKQIGKFLTNDSGGFSVTELSGILGKTVTCRAAHRLYQPGIAQRTVDADRLVFDLRLAPIPQRA